MLDIGVERFAVRFFTDTEGRVSRTVRLKGCISYLH